MRDGQLGRADLGLGQPLEDVVAVERDVDGAELGRLGSPASAMKLGQPLGQRHARGADADQHQVADAGVALDDLVRDALERANDAGAVEQVPASRSARRSTARFAYHIRGRAACSHAWHAGIILIGDEILSGKVRRRERPLSHRASCASSASALRRIAVIPDVLDEIADDGGASSPARFDHVFTSGGVGPTHDDLTMEGVARAFGAKVIRHPELEGLLRGYYGERLQERNLRMADVPDGAHFVHGEPSAGWPVIAMRNVYILPGVPEMFRKKFKSIRERFRDQPFHLRQRVHHAEEGHIAARARSHRGRLRDGAGRQLPDVLDSRDYKVKVTIEGKDADAVRKACEDLVRALGTAVVRVE